MKFAVIKTGGKQYFIKENDEIVVDYVKKEKGEEIELDALAEGDLEKNTIELGKPFLEKKVKAKVIDNIKGDKIRVARFKSKVRYRKVKGFRPMLSKIKAIQI